MSSSFSAKVNTLVFTDLDGTLLNHDDYSYQAALPAIERLREQNIPLILVSSKTRAEMAELCSELNITDPYVCENGSLIVMPDAWVKTMGLDTDGFTFSDGAWQFVQGADRQHITALLTDLKSRFEFTGFADMSVNQVIDCTGLSEQGAAQAKQRFATEPMLWHDSSAALDEFAQQLSMHDLRVVKGGRFYHVMAYCDKSDAVRYLLDTYESHYGAKVKSIALGDSPNDLVMLKEVDQAVVMPHKDGTYMHDNELLGEIRAPQEGASGWRAGVEAALQKLRNGEDA
ncbi:HAD-IIB family hydrolase [Gilvimarinus agarilyticus]|uniref:HAD-IIB family hydrolase n=1 Tax=Gilvimarinus agarilyticus TaxID=679259 RepID=UPI0006971E2D|nr:HAD-IIB family hydrolase [Gilvimarinus agarilyticus]